MTKTQLALCSLVAAVPAGFLAYSLVMVFLTYAENLKLFGQITAGLSLLASVGLALVPVGILVLGGRGKAAKKSKTATGEAGSGSESISAVEELEDGEQVAATSKMESFADLEETEFTGSSTDDAIEIDGGSSEDSLAGSDVFADSDAFDAGSDAFEVEELEIEEEPPKKKKKK